MSSEAVIGEGMHLRNDLMDLIITDHRKVDKLFQDYKKATDINQKRQIALMVCKELALHAGKEEMVVYPVLQKRVNAQMTSHAVEEHQGVKILCQKLEATHIQHSERVHDQLMQQIEQEVTHHVKEEEEQILPALAKALSYEERHTLGTQFVKAQMLVPEHAHPELRPLDVDGMVRAKQADDQQAMTNEDMSMKTGRV